MEDVVLTPRESEVYSFILEQISDGCAPTVREICTATGISSTSVVHKILSRLESLSLIKKNSHSSRSIKPCNVPKAVNVPILGKVAAGIPIVAVQDIEGYIPVAKTAGDTGNMFALRVRGLSMKNAGILDGDVVIADRDCVPQENDIVIALIDDEATVKRLKYNGGRPVLMPENEDFEPIIPENLTILGKVVGSYRQY